MEKEVLLEQNGVIEFLIEFEEGDYEVSVQFKVFEVTSWSTNEKVIDTEKYLEGYIKWDGCSHIWFGDEDKYIHLCGVGAWKNHNQVMDAIWEVCSKKIKKWSPI